MSYLASDTGFLRAVNYFIAASLYHGIIFAIAFIYLLRFLEIFLRVKFVFDSINPHF